MGLEADSASEEVTEEEAVACNVEKCTEETSNAVLNAAKSAVNNFFFKKNQVPKDLSGVSGSRARHALKLAELAKSSSKCD